MDPIFVFSCVVGSIFHAVRQLQEALQLSKFGIETALQLVASRRLQDVSCYTVSGLITQLERKTAMLCEFVYQTSKAQSAQEPREQSVVCAS